MLEPWEQEIKWGSDSDENMSDSNNNEESWVGEIEEVKNNISNRSTVLQIHKWEENNVY